MDAVHIDEYAQRLYAAHGDQAEYEAAQRARRCEDKGAAREADQWRRVRSAIRILRGPHAT
jgi:hypothetical protein